mmetsp:Transcript_107556/g.304142  ORF Transcript_107556/g.304142 Transcript_107556/m.304142 type:complete len:274 (-) Transcript_107556:482-1303(-)
MAAKPTHNAQAPGILCRSSASALGSSSMLETCRNVPLASAMHTPLTGLCALPRLTVSMPTTQPMGVPAAKIATKAQNFQLGRSDFVREQPNAKAASPLCANTARITGKSSPLSCAEPMPSPSITEWKLSAKNRRKDFASAMVPPPTLRTWHREMASRSALGPWPPRSSGAWRSCVRQGVSECRWTRQQLEWLWQLCPGAGACAGDGAGDSGAALGTSHSPHFAGSGSCAGPQQPELPLKRVLSSMSTSAASPVTLLLACACGSTSAPEAPFAS